MNVVSVSENTVLVLFEQSISSSNSSTVVAFTKLITTELSEIIIDIVPSYASIHISFNLRKTSHQAFIKRLSSLKNVINKQEADSNKKKLLEIPVYYGEEVGLDLTEMVLNTGLSIEQIIQRHSEVTYDVYALGFSPGFAYLGSVDKRIATPRKPTPRLKIPKGSLGIADSQTAIYPFDSPGGWNIIGRTPVELVDYNQQPLCIMQVGDRIKFTPIDKEEYLSLGGEV